MHAPFATATPLHGTYSVGSAYQCGLTRDQLIAALTAYQGERRLAFFRHAADGSIVCAVCGLHLGAHPDSLTRGEVLLAFLLLGALAVATVGWLCASLVWLLGLGPVVVVLVATTRR
jgi:hypothetical protein